ncbi:MAG: hypothetical protein R8M11_02465 [Gallionella sp.]
MKTTTKQIQIFKPGKHVAMSGVALSFSESDLAATAAAYDPAKHEAPLVVGHPKHDDPAYGWVQSLAFADGIEASSHQVDPAFAEMVERGAFKKISASFYAPDAPSNPVPGVYYLRHVGFLGAKAPAVKGLRAPEFADAEEGVIEFADWGDVQSANILRSLREWIIGKFGRYEADKAIPSHLVQSMEAKDAPKEDTHTTTPSPALIEPQPEGDSMSDADKARLAALEKENAAFAEAEKKRTTEARHTEHVSFADGLIAGGKLLPINKDVTVATLDFMANQEDEEISFGEGDAKQPLIAAFKASLHANPKLVEFGEVAGISAEDANAVNFAAPAGFTVDGDRLELHQKALAYQSKNKTTYNVALAAISA